MPSRDAKKHVNAQKESILIDGLPRLPSLVRYEDIFTEKSVTLKNLDDEAWIISDRGRLAEIDFTRLTTDLRIITKLVACRFLSEGAASTVLTFINACYSLDAKIVREALILPPYKIKSFWSVFCAQERQYKDHWALKSFLFFACEYSLFEWSPLWRDLISWLPSPVIQKWASVRTGEAFLSLSEESDIVHFLDSMNSAVRANPRQVQTDDLIDVGLLTCSYQFGMRPVQIGRVKRIDCHVRHHRDGGSSSVYLTFKLAKQRSAEQAGTAMVRKVKEEWTASLAELYSRGTADCRKASDYLFTLNSATTTGARLSRILYRVTGSYRNATDLRHSAAQRLVDSGASHEELAEFMGHTDITSGLVYYDVSANHAERVNNALGISETYTTVARVAHSKFISEAELADLKSSKQIAGAPHGIPISGIGGCASGQPQCHLNPVLACYGCPKFMPVRDISVHRQVLKDYRDIVNFYEASSRSEPSTSAFMQLRTAINDVQAVLFELGEDD